MGVHGRKEGTRQTHIHTALCIPVKTPPMMAQTPVKKWKNDLRIERGGKRK
jgi:hypothetical protein